MCKHEGQSQMDGQSFHQNLKTAPRAFKKPFEVLEYLALYDLIIYEPTKAMMNLPIFVKNSVEEILPTRGFCKSNDIWDYKETYRSSGQTP